jgi:FkbM family methyltransferase
MLRPVFKQFTRIARAIGNVFGVDIVRWKSAPFGYNLQNDIRRICLGMSRRVDVIFDVGANIGQTSVAAKSNYPAARIFAFEPTPDAFALLQKNVANLSGVQTYNFALGSEPGSAKLFLHQDSRINSLIRDTQFDQRFGASDVQEIICEVTTLDLFCAKEGIERINLLKIDTEGFELSVLKGAIGLLSGGKIDMVYLEFNEILAPEKAGGGGLVPVMELMRPHGFRFIASYSDYVVFEGGLFAVCNALLVRG